MKKIVALIVALTLFTCTVHAQIGNNGFDLGISSGRLKTAEGKKSTTQTYPYSEIVLVTGEPLVFSGTVTITKSEKDDQETYSYKYTLSNGAKNKLTRTCVYNANLSYNDNQIVRTISNNSGSKPRETINIDGLTYTLDGANSLFTLSTISDSRPACDYYAGNWNSEKTYNSKDGKQVTINMTSQVYGFDQFWGATEIQNIDVYIVGTSQIGNIYDQWGGNGKIKITQTMKNSLSYIENKPETISFSGGYLRRQQESSVLNYNINLPLFDSRGITLDTVENYKDSVEFTAMPEQERMYVEDTSAIRGYWYEESVKQLAGLGILNHDYLVNYKRLEENMTRKEFAVAIAKAVKLELIPVPVATKKNKYVEKPFTDIDSTDESYKYIYSLYKYGVMSGTDKDVFSPNEPISRAQAILIIVRMLGLETTAGTNYSITNFRDNDDIPIWAKSAVLAARKMGIVNGDENNDLHPNSPLSVVAASALINNCITYMRDGMLINYR